MINEVIETLKAYTDGKDNAGKVEISVMQLNRIIKALEQQPTDAVDRQRVLEIIEREEFKGDALFEIEMLAPVTPQPKVGRWKRISRDLYVQHAMAYYECSECGKKMIGTHNYCPNCGAKMSEIQTGEEGSDKE